MAIDRDDDAPQTSSETQSNMEGNIETQNSTIQTPLKILANKAQRKAKYEPDIDWYFAQQIHPAVLRLCECVEGMNAMALAEFLGMDTTRYRDTRRIDGSGVGSQFYRGRSFGGILSTDVLNMGDKFSSLCADLSFKCPFCRTLIVLPPVRNSHEEFDLRCPSDTCRQLLTQRHILPHIQVFVRGLLAAHFSGSLICDDPSCHSVFDTVRLLNSRCPNPGCTGHLHLKPDAETVYCQLVFLKEIFTPRSFKNAAFGHLVPHCSGTKEDVELILKHLDTTLAQSSYNKVDLGAIFSLRNLI